ncbi:MAG: efflux RND transporter periplasmic adaptor subunit [Anaerolineae bacterium]|nr:efflux RND transporter periplasmic adaptor subunit [Anaerolineae bacterium]
MRKIITIALSVVLLAGLAILASQAMRATPGASLAGYELAPVERGEIVATVNATGSVAPRSRAVLAFAATGRIAEINVSVGDRVQAGQKLATIDAREMQQAVAQAEALLRASQARLEELRRGPSPDQVNAAKASVASAQEYLNLLNAGASPREVEIARLRWEQAKDELWKAQSYRDATCGNPQVSEAAKDQSRAAVAAAEMAAEIARLQYEQVKDGPSATDIRAAEAQLAEAQANLARLTSGPSAQEIRAAQAQVDQNLAALEQARLRLEGTTLTAPFDGVVVAVNGHIGELVSVTTPVITLADLSAYHIDVEIDEASIGQVEIGQEAQIVLDAFPDKPLRGRVSRIAPAGTLSQGVVNYGVTVDLEPTEVAVKADMTASVNIVVARKANVLLVPNRSVRRDRLGRYVEIVVDNEIKRQDVEAGLSNETHTEVSKGLTEGMVVVVSAPRQSPFAPSTSGR